MSLISLNRLNKNKYRKYPFKQSSSCISQSGELLSDKVIIDISIASVYGKHRIYVPQIYKNNNYIQIAIASVFDGSLLGVFSGEIIEDYVSLYLTPYVKNISGIITLGDITNIDNLNKCLNFEKENTELEESVIFCYIPTGVSAVSDKLDQSIVGDVNFGSLVNIVKFKEENNIKLYTEFPENLYNEGDKSSYLSNCPTPIIKNINGVLPSYSSGNSSNDNNIYIAGVYPIIFYGFANTDTVSVIDDSIAGVVDVEMEGLTLTSLCTKKQKLLPPIDITGLTKEEYKDVYYNKPALESLNNPNYPYEIPARLAGNFNATLRPEYFYWPQYVRETYYDFWRKP